MSLRPKILRIFGRMPVRVRLAAVRLWTPSFRVGAMCVVRRADGAVLLVRHSYRPGWGFPGGLLKRGELPVDAAAREMHEEIGLTLDLEVVPNVVVDPRYRRVDVIYSARMPEGDGVAEPKSRSAEIVEVGWFPPGDLPPLGTEARSALAELGRVGDPTRSDDVDRRPGGR